jgi:hypothetical protein
MALRKTISMKIGKRGTSWKSTTKGFKVRSKPVIGGASSSIATRLLSKPLPK